MSRCSAALGHPPRHRRPGPAIDLQHPQSPAGHFTNPTARIPTGRPETREPLPPASPCSAKPSTARPRPGSHRGRGRFLWPRPRQLPRLRLTDIRDGRLYLPGRDVLLAEPVRERLAAYLDYRTRSWPNTANPHLFINFRTATHTGPVQADWITKLGMSAQAIREDRILHEAHATGGDIRRLMRPVRLVHTGAERYTATVDTPPSPASRPPAATHHEPSRTACQ